MVVVAALALLGVVVATVAVTISLQQEAEASCVTSYALSGNKSALFAAFEKSKGRCVFGALLDF